MPSPACFFRAIEADAVFHASGFLLGVGNLKINDLAAQKISHAAPVMFGLGICAGLKKYGKKLKIIQPAP
jgi:hypothetical protein